VNIWWYCFFQVRAAATYALGTLVRVGLDGGSTEGAEDDVDEDNLAAEQKIASLLLKVLSDGSPLVRAELAIGKKEDLRSLLNRS
jgi:regulator-associated protein of mTOR